MSELLDELWQEIAQYRARTRTISWRWVDQGDFPRIYPQQLLSAWQLSRCGSGLMESAAAVVPARHALLAEHLRAHAGEERTREAALAKELAGLGLGEAALRSALPRAGVVAMAGSQMYLIHSGWPVAIIGYLFVLEGHRDGGEDLDRVSRRTGLPYEAMFTIAEHGRRPASKADGLEALCDALELGDEEVHVVKQSAYMTARFLYELTAELATEVPDHGAAAEEH